MINFQETTSRKSHGLNAIAVSSEKFKPNTTNCEQAKPNLTTNQYRVIGKTLRIAELGSLKVGIPWLPPTKERRELFKEFYSPLAEFSRVSLVGVSTKTLELYCEDLDTFQIGTKDLFIEEIKGIDRFAYCILLFFSLALLTFTFCVILKTGTSAAIALTLLSATPAALLAMFSCNELQRRASFHTLIYKEFLRRRGQDEEGSNGILLTLET